MLQTSLLDLVRVVCMRFETQFELELQARDDVPTVQPAFGQTSGHIAGRVFVCEQTGRCASGPPQVLTAATWPVHLGIFAGTFVCIPGGMNCTWP